MAYSFPPDIAQRMQAQMMTGQFLTEDDVLREAIDALERRQQSLRTLQAMVREADEDISAGRVGTFDADETKRAVRMRLAQHGVTD
jgi:Arc/MetJ-type ribon-helix-helix transcriptional regulator